MSGLRLLGTLAIASAAWIAVVLAFAFSTSFSSPGGYTLFVALCVCAIAATVVYLGLAFSARTRRDPDQVSEPTGSEFPKAALDALVAPTGPVELSDLTAGVFLEAVLNPRDVFSRISEHITPNHRTISRRINFSAVLDPSGSPENVEPDGHGHEPDKQTDVVLPLLATPRGRLVDGLRVTGDDGKRVSTLPTLEQHLLVMAVIRYLAWLASDDALDRYIAQIERDLWTVLSAGNSSFASQVARRVRELLDAQDSEFDYGEQAEALIQEVATYQYICVVVSTEHVAARAWPHMFRFGLEARLLGPVENPPAPQATWFDFLDDLRLAFGVKLNRIYFPVDLAFRARRYHLEVEGPEGTYVSAQEIIEFPSTERNLDIEAESAGEAARPQGAEASPSSQPGLPSLFKGYFQPLRGQRRGHLYVTDVSSAKHFGLAASFFERAPGTLAGVLLAGLSATLVIGIISVRQIMGAASDPGVADGLLPALLAVPLAVTALGALDGAKTVRHPSLLSRALTFATLALCLLTLVFSAASRFTGTLPVSTWMLLTATSALVSLVAGMSWMLRIAVERNIRRGGTPDTEYIEPRGQQ